LAASGKKIFFASDFHLGLDSGTHPSDREKKVVSWLDSIAPEAQEIFLLGDVFDFWWEYKLVVPKGFTRFLGKVASITDSGIPVHFFTGNHDMWVGNYLTDECGIIIHEEPFTTVFNDRKFHLAHGEGLGSRNNGYRILLKIFRNRLLRALYSSLHPTVGISIGHRWSLNSRLSKGISLEFLGEDKEDLVRYAGSLPAEEKIDYFIFGHRHLAMKFRIKQGGEIIFLGDWIKHGSFAVWDGEMLTLKEVD
jgi:UDP-2,3-diacylglucosamine hydrolase